MSCSENDKPELSAFEEVKIKHVLMEDVVEPPPPDLHSPFQSLQEWLVGLCDGNKPDKPVNHYKLGFFESSLDRTIFFVGINNSVQGDTSHSDIVFEPVNMYFKLPETAYGQLERDVLIKKLTTELMEFTQTDRFKTSFMKEADSIVFESNGQKIWSK